MRQATAGSSTATGQGSCSTRCTEQCYTVSGNLTSKLSRQSCSNTSYHILRPMFFMCCFKKQHSSRTPVKAFATTVCFKRCTAQLVRHTHPDQVNKALGGRPTCRTLALPPGRMVGAFWWLVDMSVGPSRGPAPGPGSASNHMSQMRQQPSHAKVQTSTSLSLAQQRLGQS